MNVTRAINCENSPSSLCNHSLHKHASDCMKVLEKVSAIALGVFSAYVSKQLFIPAFIAGIGIGIYSYVQEKQSEHAHSSSSCAQGLLEQLTGVKLPPVVSLATNLGATVCHIEHHSSVFVPIIALSLGAWVGKTASHYGMLAHKQIEIHTETAHKQAQTWNFEGLREIQI